MYRFLLVAAACFFLFLTIPHVVWGHTSLEQATPEEGMVTAPPTDIILLFNTTIGEQSTVQLTTAAGEPVPLTSLSVEEETLYADIDADLSEGEYQITWSIVGADGHGIEDSYTFHYEEESSPDSSGETGEPEPVSEEENAALSSERADPPLSTAFLLGGFFILAIVSAIMLRRRRTT